MGEPVISMGAAALPEPDRAWLAAVEQLPIDSVWVGGHVLPPSATGEVITRLSLLTAWTERVRVGTGVTLLPLYSPVILAKQLADLDAHSAGRLTVGVGVGGEFPDEFDAVGVDLPERGARTDEAMAVMRALWAGGPTTFPGRFTDLDGAELRPVDLPEGRSGRPGGPPIVVSGRKAPAMRRAARHGDGWMPYLFSPDAYARSVATIEDEAERAGRSLEGDGFEWLLFLYCCIRPDEQQARDEAATFLGGAYGALPPEKLDRLAAAGTPEQVAEKVQAYVDAGVRHVIISPATREDTLGVVRLAAEEVRPRLVVSGS